VNKESGGSVVKNNIRIIRVASGLSQGQLARLANTHQSHLSHIEHENIRPSLDLAKKIAAALEVPVEDLGYDIGTLRPYTKRPCLRPRTARIEVKRPPFLVRLWRRLSL